MRKGCLTPLILILAFIGYGFLEIWIESNRATYYAKGEDFSIDDLPPSAHDVKYVSTAPFSPLGRAYEFKCSEQDYKTWVDQTLKDNPKLSNVRQEKDRIVPFISREGEFKRQIITDILISDWTLEDQGIYLVYDKKASRAIRWSHSR
ncbi:MAG: hypothetical protein ACSHX6_15110 [Akkermansiaceae bacterium]